MAVADGMKFGVQAAPGLANQTSTPPFFSSMPVAVRCAFKYVVSIARQLIAMQSMGGDHDSLFFAVLGGQAHHERAKTPLSVHRFQRLYRVLCRPYSFGASRHRKPLRLRKIIPPALADHQPLACHGVRRKRASDVPSALRSARKGRSYHRAIFDR